jgi:hypothetical protein
VTNAETKDLAAVIKDAIVEHARKLQEVFLASSDDGVPNTADALVALTESVRDASYEIAKAINNLAGAIREHR